METLDKEIRILVVEDQPVCRLGIRMTLSSSGIKHRILAETENVSQAIDFLEKKGNDADLVLLDYVLPDGTGMDVIQAVKRLHLELKIVILSGEAGGAIIKQLMDGGARRESIGVFYVTPCAAKIAAVKYPVSGKETCVTGVINMDFLYNKVQLLLHDSDKDAQPINHALTSRGVLWPLAGGEAALYKGDHYAVDGLQNVLNFLEKLEDEAVDAPGIVEMRICDQGCVGGVLATNNRFVARKRLEYRARLFDRLQRTRKPEPHNFDPEFTAYLAKEMEIPEIKPRSIYELNDDFSEAFKMATRMRKIEKALPGVNCSACGAPSGAALAEDLVRGEARMDTCIFINRHSQASEDAIRSIWGDRVRTKEINEDNNNNNQ